METYKIEPGGIISIDVKEGFYLAQSMVSLKAVVLNEMERNNIFHFKIRFKSITGAIYESHVTLTPPYFFEAGTFNSDNLANRFEGPYNVVEVESLKDNPSAVIQFGFSNRLA